MSNISKKQTFHVPRSTFHAQGGFTPTPILKTEREIVTNDGGLFRSRIHQLNSLGIGVSFAEAKRGFTLVESLVAITIVLISVVGPLTIISKTLSFARFARDEITAFYLAQDAVEFIRNKRDNNVIANDEWLAGLSSCIGGVCAVDSTAGVVFSCGTSCDPLKLSTSGVYGYTNGENTMFVRDVTMSEVSVGREATIDVTLRWNQGLLERNFTIREYMFNWQ